MNNIPTVKQIIIRITAIIVLVELAIMIFFANASLDLTPYTEAILDVAVLAGLSTPIIYIWIIKPYVVAHEEILDQISHMAYHDPLTQLANRRLLSEYLGKLLPGFLRYKVYGALLFIDLDGFKVINDNHGHDAGDTVLIEVAKRLNSFVRTGDIISRIGGDEFVIVLAQLAADEQTANKEALLTSERIQKELSKTIEYKGMSLQIGSSIGLRLLKPEQISVDAVLKDADADMYRAKQAGNR